MHPDNALMQRPPVPHIGTTWMVVAALLGLLLSACSPEEPVATVSATPEPTPEPTPSPTLNAELMDRPWNVLYVGIDVNEAREGAGEPSNTDALMLVSLSEDQSELTLVSLPRDTVDVPLADGTIYPRKINGLYAEQGIEALVGAMETLYDLEIDGHVVLDMDDVAALVEAVDGVEVTLEEPLADPIVDLNLEPGTQILDAGQALGYVRTRVDQDYGRMGRQQEVIVELVDRLVDPDTELDLMELLDGLDSLATDLPLDELLTLLELAERAGDAEVSNLVIQPPLIVSEGDIGDGRGYILIPDVEAIRAEVHELIGE
jgi:polyisoprenyl-teichoic acid--peptidoglycan teichoic acid transferase